MKPIKLTSERAWRTYMGGRMIDALHGKTDCADSHFPEEWIMSTTAARNVGREHIKNEGMSCDASNGRTLKEIIKENPEEMLGKEHYTMFGADTGVLIKIIDSAERLAVQVHPDKRIAKRLFNSDYGKTECWHILGGRNIDGEPPCIYLGFKNGVMRELWKNIFEKQDIGAMLNCLHKIPVKKGETYLIPGGVPHAIGGGCFLMEIQEPTDYTIRTERTTPSGFRIADELCHQGLGFDRMFDCFIYDGKDDKQNLEEYKVTPRICCGVEELVGYESTHCFRLCLLKINSLFKAETENTFRGLYVIAGSGFIEDAAGKKIPVKSGDQFFIPANTQLSYHAETSELIIAHLYGPKII